MLCGQICFSQQSSGQGSPIADLIKAKEDNPDPVVPPIIPGPAKTETAPATEDDVLPETHVVRYGDNPWTIAKAYRVSMKELLAVNQIKDTKNLQIGQELKLPRNRLPKESTPAAPVTEEEFDPGDHEVYTIEKGDNPWTIAKRLKINYEDLINLNKIEDPKDLKIGQKLILPKKGEKVAGFVKSDGTVSTTEPEFDADGHDVYVIKSGDNPWTVARQLKIDYQELLALNDIKNPRDLKIGQKLKLPKKEDTSPAVTPAPPAPEKAEQEAPFDADGHDVYVIKSGDNPWTIAKQLKIDYQALVDLNNISDPKDLKIGQKLKLPKNQ